ncbi:MAG: BamA/TamA family outer membrane protein [Ignavibacteria bacterium]|nr:BamA/TamA family outer membrane protein [Ignavibacteria bacterium]MBT8392175.1 BamA/TamA family outer membrane protein [Ignavibacteria bacterium]NNJ53835.1 BamA/TamA family outer membrane protein [Ignavibacteriaceae bacterium]NNL20514.1 BamA/TamA family outer membrane protein [Ignavibacteriaceae bacterium]
MKLFLRHIVLLIFVFSVVNLLTFAQQAEQYELSSISFSGNNNFSDTELKLVLQSKENPWWLWRFLDSFTFLGSPPNYFDSTSVLIDIISLKSFYAVNGFFEADIIQNYEIDTSGKSVELEFIVDENDMFTFGDSKTLGLQNLSDFDKSKINQFLQYSTRSKFSQNFVQTNNESIINYLRNSGYMLSEYDSSVIKIDSVINKVHMTSFFTLGKWYNYSDIRIEKSGEGEQYVSDELIKYLSNINPGDTYKEDELFKSRVRLARTGLFNTVNLSPVEEDTSGSKVPLLIIGNVGSLNELSPEVFADNELSTFNLGVGASYVRKNFLGDARKLTVRLRFRVRDVTNLKFGAGQLDETFQSEIDLSTVIEQPFLFSRSIAGRLEGFLKSYRIFQVDYENFGAIFTSTVDMPSYTFVNLLNPFLRFERLTYDVPFTSIEGDSASVSPRTLTFSLGTEVGSTTTNDIFFPTAGRTLSLITEISSADVKWEVLDRRNSASEVFLDSLGFYLKLQLTYGSYFSISRDENTVLGIKVKSGYIQMLSGDPALVSPNQTFFAGGSNSVRGWKARDLIPKNPPDDLFPPTINEQFRIRGGIFLLEGSFEYRRKFEEQFGFALFADYGNTWNNLNEVRFDEIAVAVGTGLRYYSPIAPFRIDFGFKFYDPADKKFIFDKAVFKTLVFHFGIGEAF